MNIERLGKRAGLVDAMATFALAWALATLWQVGADAAIRDAGGTASVAGRWDAIVVVNDSDIPFRFDMTGTGDNVRGSFFNGDTKITSKRGQFKDGVLSLMWEQYASTLDATLKDGRLEGIYKRAGQKDAPFRASRFVQGSGPTGEVPSISGEWKILLPIDKDKGDKAERAWRLIVHQSGPEVTASVLRVDGDTGTLTGTFHNGTVVLSHFSGARPNRFDITPAKDGSLDIVQYSKKKLTAFRIDDPRAKGVPEPTDPSQHTRMKDANERFRFSFPDLNGKVVTESDPRFQGKVLLVNIAGSWCANCRDETPFLVNLYKKLHKRGFEVVALAFEEGDQLKNPTRLRGFIKEYGIDYTVLLAGDPDQLTEKVPQAENLTAFPTSFLLGRDGKVRWVHAGFPSTASGAFFAEAQRETTAQVERLLAERPAGTK